jgi:Kef-type K+ transport system membrane component KefB
MGHDLLLSVLSVLVVSVAAIAACQRIGFSPVLGYLATGILALVKGSTP